jgi:hypothetical protein
MKIRGLLIAAVLLAVLAGILYWSDHRKSTAEAAKPDADAAPEILKLDENSITKLDVKKKDAAPIELDKSGSQWKITEPKSFTADQSTVRGMLSALSSLNSERLVDDKSSDLQRYGLAKPSLELDVTEKDSKMQRLLLGDDTPAGSAVYAALAGSPRVFTIPGYTRNTLDKSLNDLRDKRLLTVSPDKISRIDIAGKNGNIEFGRSKDEWQILKPTPMRADGSAVSEFVNKLTDARIDLSGSDSASKEADSAFSHGTRVARVKVTDESGNQELQLRRNKDSYYAKSSVVDGAYKVGSEFGDVLNKKVEDFRNKKLFDFGYADPNKIEIHSGSKTYSLFRGGQDWWDNGKKMDDANVQSLISNLREISAENFVNSGFTAPELEATVTSNDGKRVEKVQISKSGSKYIGKRENDPALYQLSAGAIEQLQQAVNGIKPASSPSK